MQQENKMNNQVEKMKKVHAVVLAGYTRKDKQKNIDHFVTFYKNGAIKTLTESIKKMKDLSESIISWDTFYDLHMYVALIILTKKTYDSLKSIRHNTLVCQTFKDIQKFKDSFFSGQEITKQIGTVPSEQLIKTFCDLDITFQESILKYSNLYEGKGEINQETPSTIIIEGVPFDMYNDDPDVMVKLQQEGLELFIKKNIDYGDVFVKYGKIGVIINIDEKIRKLASMTINDDINDILIDLFNYTAMGLMFYNI